MRWRAGEGRAGAGEARRVGVGGWTHRLAWLLVAMEAAAAIFVAATPWLRAYHVAGMAVLLAVAAGGSLLVAVGVGVWWRQAPLVSYACSLAGLIILLVVGVTPHLGSLVQGAARGPSQLLTDTLPLISPRSLVVPAVALCWVAGAATGELLCRSARTGPALLVPIASFVAAYAFSSGAPGTDRSSGAVLLAVIAALAVTRRELAETDRPRATPGPAPPGPGGRRATWDSDGGPGGLGQLQGRDTGPGDGAVWGRVPRAALGGGVFAAVVAVVAWQVVPGLPGLGKPGIALSRRPATATEVTISPVDAVAALRDNHPRAPATTMFSVRTDAASNGYLALAPLDHYDGDTWGFDRTFDPTGGRVPPPPPGTPATVGALVRQTYTLRRSLGPSLPLVPYLDRPVQVGGLTLDEDPVSGMVLPVGPVPAGATYSVTSVAPLGTLSQLPATAAVATVGSGIDSQLPANADTDLTGTLQYLATLTGQRPAPTVSFLQAALAALVRTDRRVDPVTMPAGGPANGAPSRGGTSLAEVIDATTVSRQATPEQFATLFVVVARALGVPARLVTGFRISEPAVGGVGAGMYQVTNRQAWTWAEVAIAGSGWVVADPTPAQTATSSSLPPIAKAQTTATTVSPPQANAVPGNGFGGHALAPPTAVHLPHRTQLSPVWVVGGVILFLLALAAAALGLAGARRSLRRLSRRRGDPDAAAVGAWLELLDGLDRSGINPGRAATTGEVAELAGHSYGPELAEPVRMVGDLADRALCSNQSGVDRTAAAAAWKASLQVNRKLSSRLSRPQRLRAALTVGHHPRRPATRRPPARPGPTRPGAKRSRRSAARGPAATQPPRR